MTTVDIQGKPLRITMASFSNAMALKKAVERAIKQEKLEFSFDVKSLSEDAMPSLIQLLLSVDSSDAVEDALFACCASSIFGADSAQEKVTRDFFEKEEHRQYYYPIMIEILKVNLGPFFATLGSLLSNLGVNQETSQPQK